MSLGCIAAPNVCANNTAISPELIPSQDPDSDMPGADSESVVGPYELQDFFLYYTLRFGYRPSKVAFLAHHAGVRVFSTGTEI